MHVCMRVMSLQSCLTPCDPMDCIAHQAPLSIRFLRQGYWSGLPFPSPGDLPNPGIEPGSPALQADSLPTELFVFSKTSLEYLCFKRWVSKSQASLVAQMVKSLPAVWETQV